MTNQCPMCSRFVGDRPVSHTASCPIYLAAYPPGPIPTTCGAPTRRGNRCTTVIDYRPCDLHGVTR